MKTIAKTILGTLMLAGTAIAVAAPANAGFSIGIGFGPPRYHGPAVCDPYSRYYDPYMCDEYDSYYGPPVFIDGYWYDGPIRSRWYNGHREFWVHNGWRYSDRYRGGGRFEHGHGDWGRDRGGWGHGDGGHGGGGHGGGHGGGGHGGGHH